MYHSTPLPTLGERAAAVTDLDAIRLAAFGLLDRMQNIDPAIQIAALGSAYVAVCAATGLDPHEEIGRSARRLASAEGPFTAHFQAIRDYAAGELRKL